MKTAIITGGSSGIGLEFARQLAAKKFSLLLIAHDDDQLKNAARDLQEKFGTKVEILAGDLAEDKFIAKVCAQIRDTRNLEFLINCAGFGLHESLLDDSEKAFAKQNVAFKVMAQNVLEFSAIAAQKMKSRGRGKIINVASTNAWLYSRNYSALKSWLVSYTEALAIELRGSGVFATAVAPSWMHTNFHRNAGLDKPSVPEFLFVKPEMVVQTTLRAAEEGKILHVPSVKWKIIIWCLAHGPRELSRFVSQKYMNSKNYKNK